MPFEPLLQRLTEKSKGWVMRADRGLPEKPEDVSQAQWKPFANRTKAGGDLWVQYVVPG